MYPSFKSHILLPVIFVLTTSVAVLFIAKEDFIEDLSPLIVWFYFAVALIYTSIAIVDVITNKDKSKKLKTFIIIMSILVVIVTILYAIFYIIAKGR